MEQREPVDGRDACRGRRLGVVIDEDGERNAGVAHEGRGVTRIARPDGDDVAAFGPDLVVALAQLRGMFTTMQSTEVAQEDERDGAVFPERPDLARRTSRVGQLERTQPGNVHVRRVYARPPWRTRESIRNRRPTSAPVRSRTRRRRSTTVDGVTGD